MNPVLDFARMVLRHGAQRKYWPRVVVYLVKLALWEPFRLLERLQMRLQGEPKALPLPPVFVLGYYRSGTTHLQEALLQDPQFAYMNFYQCFFSTAFHSNERLFKRIFDAMVRPTGLLHPAHRVPFRFDLPAEEDVAMIFSGSAAAANWGQMFPTRFRDLYGPTAWLTDVSPELAHRFSVELHHLLWRVSKQNGHKRLVLKSPPHTGRLALLRRMYPGARFVFIRRDPYDVFASNKGLWASFRETWLEDVGPDEVRDHILWSYRGALENYDRDKALLGQHELAEVSYEDLVADPTGTMRRIYETLGLGDFESVRPGMEAFLRTTHPAPRHRLTDEEIEAVEAQLSPWIDAWGVPRRGVQPARGAA